MNRLRILLSISILGVGCASAPVPPAAGGHFVARSLQVEGHTFAYQVFVPAQRGPAATPIVLFLHGSGERGNDNRRQLEAGLGPWLKHQAASFPALVVLPQAPQDTEWLGRSARMALATLDAASAEFHGDPHRTYLTGMSMGGYGTWELALMQPYRFAALVPVCGAIHAPPDEQPGLLVDQLAGEADPYTALATRLRTVPVWMFHGAEDDLVPPDNDRRIYRAGLKQHANIRYTEYPGTNHNAWDPTYRNPAMWQWLFQHRRG
ncbi:phospholipase [Stenotrophomonas sp. YIM B06876]|uniref:carboxylesterase family protein n=1 Tax=Stenotrophomonas sp. YIM B06876 TaxID=3060211 RepID=UPI0027391C7C|nr:phospholipase [Stenotrophomonas sp. YIM B06876]